MLLPSTSRQKMVDTLVFGVQAKALWEERIGEEKLILPDTFLRHSFETVPFYIHRNSSGFSMNWTDMPLVGKDKIVSNPMDFCSSTFNLDCLDWKTTSGSTGIPLRICRDPASLYGFLYDSYRLFAHFIPNFAQAICPGKIGVVLVVDNPNRVPMTMINPALSFSLNHQVVLGRSKAEDNIVVQQLRQTQIPLIYGRPRSLHRLYELDMEIPPSGRHITAMAALVSGDNLYDDERHLLESWFKCPVFNAYGSQEAGLVGVECEHKTGIHVFDDRILLEILTTSGDLKREGAGEMIITNMANWAMPFIRYRSGDYAKVVRSHCPCGHNGWSIAELSGRDSVYFVFPKNRKFNPSLLNPLFEKVQVKQFQIIQQRDSSLVVRWIPWNVNRDVSDIEKFLETEFNKLLSGVKVNFECVDTIGEVGKKVQRFSSVLWKF